MMSIPGFTFVADTGFGLAEGLAQHHWPAYDRFAVNELPADVAERFRFVPAGATLAMELNGTAAHDSLVVTGGNVSLAVDGAGNVYVGEAAAGLAGFATKAALLKGLLAQYRADLEVLLSPQQQQQEER